MIWNPAKVALAAGGSVVALSFLAAYVQRIAAKVAIRNWNRKALAQWQPFALARGWSARIEGNHVVIRGALASRPFALDSTNGLTHGLNQEPGLRIETCQVASSVADDEQPTKTPDTIADDGLLISPRGFFDADYYGALREVVGEERFGQLFCVRAKGKGLEALARLGPEERRLLLEFHPEMGVFQRGTNAWVRIGYGMKLPQIEAAARIVTALWPASETTPQA